MHSKGPNGNDARRSEHGVHEKRATPVRLGRSYRPGAASVDEWGK